MTWLTFLDNVVLESRKWRFQRFSRGIFHRDAMLFRPITRKTQDWEQCRRNVPGVPRHCTVRTFHRSKPKYAFKVIQNWETDALQYILFGGAYFCRQLW